MSPAWRTHLQLHLCDCQLSRSLCFLIDRLEVAAASSFKASSRAHSTWLLHCGVSLSPDSNIMCEIHQYSGVAVQNGDVFCHILHSLLPPDSSDLQHHNSVVHKVPQSICWLSSFHVCDLQLIGENVAEEMFRRHFSMLWALKTKLH